MATRPDGLRWTRDAATGIYRAENGRMTIRKDKAAYWGSHKQRERVNWVLMVDGKDLEGYGTGYDTLADAKKDAERLAGRVLANPAPNQSAPTEPAKDPNPRPIPI